MFTHSVSVLENYLRVLSQSASHPQKVSRPAVTVARESGSGASTIVKLVAQRLDHDRPGDPPFPWTVFDRNLVTMILKDHDLFKENRGIHAEDSRFRISEAFEYLLGLHPPGWTLREYTKQTIRKLASNGNVILLGRAAPIITANMPVMMITVFGLAPSAGATIGRGRSQLSGPNRFSYRETMEALPASSDQIPISGHNDPRGLWSAVESKPAGLRSN